MRQRFRAKNSASLEDYECVLLAYKSMSASLTSDKHANVKACLVRTVERNPAYAEAWANLDYVYADQYSGEYEGPPNPLLELAHAAAKRAVELGPYQPDRAVLASQRYFFFSLEGSRGILLLKRRRRLL